MMYFCPGHAWLYSVPHNGFPVSIDLIPCLGLFKLHSSWNLKHVRSNTAVEHSSPVLVFQDTTQETGELLKYSSWLEKGEHNNTLLKNSTMSKVNSK